ncbi:MAG: L-2-hydroxyglutarate oxidase [Bacillaceae bacterium]|nr:L-2-hydroxyglutarate oxidase [Bacillaceae bacterium]
MYDYVIIGAGIVGLSVGRTISQQHPDARILILEKEDGLARHQTGRNSGVIHSGIYYKPGSLKARLAKKGNEEIISFCREKGITYKVSGKVIVATKEDELPLLENLYQRGLENGLSLQKLSKEELEEKEPHVQGLQAIYVPSTGIVDFKEVAEAFLQEIQNQGGEITYHAEVTGIQSYDDRVVIETTKRKISSKYMVNCAGLYSDRIAELAGVKTELRIVPFRGEYYEIATEKRDLVSGLVYPVPNPEFPFLGVHFTRKLDGRVLIGPNAVLSFKREGYTKSDFDLKDVLNTISYSGVWKLGVRHLKEGVKEMARSFSKELFLREVRRFYPQITGDDLIPAKAGVRAQALDRDGNLIDDFKIIQEKNMVHVLNAPSPAATASIEIGREIAHYIKGLHEL